MKWLFSRAILDAILDGQGTTITAQKVYPNMKPKACIIECNRNGNKSGVIRDEIIIFYDMVQISVRIGSFSS